ncbi:MAG: sigma-70 family RNA polymerase sigma factor [Lachnospiraceae bacterium]|nr:sigma-70 family RNA polymerase sigma factor [Lachnospiraceae bacterium]
MKKNINTDTIKDMDNEYILRAKDNDEEAVNYLLNKYKYIVNYFVRNLYIQGAEKDDLIQEGMIGLFLAIFKYNPEKNATFRTFASTCIRNKLYNAIEKAAGKNNSFLNSYISLNPDNSDGDNSNMGIEDIEDSSQNPEQKYVEANTDLIPPEVVAKFSEFEKQVFKYLRQGLNYREIAEKVEKPAKSVDNAIQRIRGKIVKYMK